MERDAGQLLAQVGLDVASATPLSTLSPAEQQLVEIAKALSLDARLIIFDEPTAALTEAETQHAVRRHPLAASSGHGGHLHLAPAGGDLRDRRPRDGAEGRPLARDAARLREATPQELVRRMVGRDVGATRRASHRARQHTAAQPRPRWKCRDLSDPPSARQPAPMLQGRQFSRPRRRNRRPGRPGRRGPHRNGALDLRRAPVRQRPNCSSTGRAVANSQRPGRDRRRHRLPARRPQAGRPVPRDEHRPQRGRGRPGAVRQHRHQRVARSSRRPKTIAQRLRHCLPERAAAGPQPQRRQSAEGAAGQVAARRAAGADRR